MSYSTIMVHLQIGQPNDSVLDAAKALAETRKATFLGVAVTHKDRNLHEEDYVITAGLIERDLPAFQEKIQATEASFRTALQGNAEIEWHEGATYHSLTEYLAEEARGVDLIITGPAQPAATSAQSLQFDLLDLVARSGRPVLGVPKTPPKPPAFARAMVCWKDTLETRRALAAALPLLQRAAYVSLVQTASGHDLTTAPKQMERVTQWLNRHGVTADPMVIESNGDDTAQLRATANQQDPDYVVAGVYSHSRLHERVFGGVTRDLLRNIGRQVLLSH